MWLCSQVSTTSLQAVLAGLHFAGVFPDASVGKQRSHPLLPSGGWVWDMFAFYQISKQISCWQPLWSFSFHSSDLHRCVPAWPYHSSPNFHLALQPCVRVASSAWTCSPHTTTAFIYPPGDFTSKVNSNHPSSVRTFLSDRSVPPLWFL